MHSRKNTFAIMYNKRCGISCMNGLRSAPSDRWMRPKIEEQSFPSDFNGRSDCKRDIYACTPGSGFDHTAAVSDRIARASLMSATSHEPTKLYVSFLPGHEYSHVLAIRSLLMRIIDMHRAHRLRYVDGGAIKVRVLMKITPRTIPD